MTLCEYLQKKQKQKGRLINIEKCRSRNGKCANEKTHPASLSYHETSFTKSFVSAMPAFSSKMDECLSPIMSDETMSLF